MSERELLYERMQALLEKMDLLDPDSEAYQKLLNAVKTFGELINKESELEERNIETESRETIEKEKVDLEREKIESEEKRAQDKNRADVRRAWIELAARVVQGVFLVIGMILNIRSIAWILEFEKKGAITSKAFQFVAKSVPKFV